MPTWLSRIPHKRWLFPSLLVAITITALSDIGEAGCVGELCAGHETGIFFSELAFAFVGAYIFNWLVVERPKARALRGYYAAAISSLLMMVRGPSTMIEMAATGPANEVSLKRPSTAAEIRDVLNKGYWAELAEAGVNVRQHLKNLDSQIRQAYREVVPILHSFEPPVAVALAHIDAAPIHDFVDRLETHETMFGRAQFNDLLALYLHGYEQAANELRQAITESHFMPEDLKTLILR